MSARTENGARRTVSSRPAVRNAFTARAAGTTAKATRAPWRTTRVHFDVATTGFGVADSSSVETRESGF
jgi:hypothetical protein